MFLLLALILDAATIAADLRLADSVDWVCQRDGDSVRYSIVIHTTDDSVGCAIASMLHAHDRGRALSVLHRDEMLGGPENRGKNGKFFKRKNQTLDRASPTPATRPANFGGNK